MKVADAAATLGLKKFGAGQKDEQGHVALTPEQVHAFVKVLAEDENLGERRGEGRRACGCKAVQGLGLRVVRVKD